MESGSTGRGMKEGRGCCWDRSSYWGTDGDGRRGGRRERRNDAGQDVGWGGNDWLVNAVEVTRASTLTVQWVIFLLDMEH